MAFNPKRLIPLGIIGVLVAGGVYLDRQRSAHQSLLSGVFESQPTRLSSRTGGRVREIRAREGDSVKEGDELIVFESEIAQEEAAGQMSLAEQAQLKSQEAKNGPRPEDIQRQSAVVAELQANLTRLLNGPLPEEVVIANQKVREAQARLTLLQKGAKPEDLRVAKAAEEQARASLAAAKRGPTQEEKAQAEARFQAANANAKQSAVDAQRARDLFEQGAISRSAMEAAQTRAEVTESTAAEAGHARDRVVRGTPPEELRQAEQAFQQAHYRYESLRSGVQAEEIKQAVSELRIAQENAQLIRRGPRSEDIQAARARLEQAQATLDSLRNGTRHEEIAQAEATAAAATHAANASRSKASESTLVAPMDGIIDRLLVAKGDLVAAGAPVVQMSDPTDIWLRVYLPENQLTKVKIGDTATLRVDGLDQAVEAVVESVSSQGEFTPANLQTPEERGKQTFAVRLRLKASDPHIRAGSAASVIRMGQWP